MIKPLAFAIVAAIVLATAGCAATPHDQAAALPANGTYANSTIPVSNSSDDGTPWDWLIPFHSIF